MSIIINSEHSPEIGRDEVDNNEENEYIIRRASLEEENQNWWHHGDNANWPSYSA